MLAFGNPQPHLGVLVRDSLLENATLEPKLPVGSRRAPAGVPWRTS
jgi:hypothetical protein